MTIFYPLLKTCILLPVLHDMLDIYCINSHIIISDSFLSCYPTQFSSSCHTNYAKNQFHKFPKLKAVLKFVWLLGSAGGRKLSLTVNVVQLTSIELI